VKKVLILFCHPALENSRVNRAWVDRVSELKGVHLHDLYEEYPNFDIDIPREQRLLTDNDIVVLQHPLYWYSPPALLKQWFELTLQHGWAYGKGGEALKGKTLISAISTGGKQEAYSLDGFHGTTMEQLLTPVRQTAKLCGMHYLSPFLTHGAFTMTEEDVAQSASDYSLLITSLRDEKLDLRGAQTKKSSDPHNPEVFSRESI
jgi:glutathione-regulated potassium-efflux system ancillary protein KefG